MQLVTRLVLLAAFFVCPNVLGIRDDDEPANFGLKCYQCGINQEQETCDEFENRPRWAPYEVWCEKGHICAKTVAPSGVIRSCTAPTTAYGKPHQDGCHEFPSKNGMHCFCSTNLCNTALVLRPSYLFYVTLFLFVWGTTANFI